MDNFELFEKIASEKGGLTVKLAQDIVTRVNEKLAAMDKEAAPISDLGRSYISNLRKVNPGFAEEMASRFGKVLTDKSKSVPVVGGKMPPVDSFLNKAADPRIQEAVRRASPPVKSLPSRSAPQSPAAGYMNPQVRAQLKRALGGR